MGNIKANSGIRRKSKSIWPFFLIIFIITAAVAGFRFSPYWPSSTDSSSNVNLYTVKRGDLNITVVENGSIKPVKSVNIKTPALTIDYYSNIAYIIPEGTIIQPEDVNNLVLCEFDSSRLVDSLPQMEIDVSAAETSFAEAKESYDMRIKQNESDVTAAELKVKFAKMDIEKYLGQIASQELLDTVSLNSKEPIDTESLIQKIQDNNSLCEASQKILELTSSINMAGEELEKSKYNLEGVQKLFDNEYKTQYELKEAELQVNRQQVNLEKAEISLALFKSFEFPKQVDQLVSDYLEAQLALDRTESSARSQLNQATVRMKSAESSLRTRQERLKDTKKQIELCTVKAPCPGQVVYYSSLQTYVQYPIEQGTQLPRGYTVIVIPDTSQLKVEIKINETWINKIQTDQPARITTTAFPDEVFEGTVIRKSPMADSQTSILSSGVKVYTTEIGIDGTYEYLKTGMTAKVEILIEQLNDVLYVPIQSVVSAEDSTQRACFVVTDRGIEKRMVETGLFNNDFVEIKSGLTEGEKVLYNPPRWEEIAEENERADDDTTAGEKQTTEDSNNVKLPENIKPETDDTDKTSPKPVIDANINRIVTPKTA